MFFLLFLLASSSSSAPVSSSVHEDHERIVTNMLNSYNSSVVEWQNQTSVEKAMLTFIVNVASDFDRPSETRKTEIFKVIKHMYEEEENGEEQAENIAKFFVSLYDLLGHIASQLGPEAKVFMKKTIRLVVEPSFLTGTDEERREMIQQLLKGFYLSALKKAVISETEALLNSAGDP